MRYALMPLAMLAALLAQGSILNLLSIRGATPNLLLCLTLSFAFMHSDGFRALLFGTLFALLRDAAFGPYVGPSAVALFLTGLAVFLTAQLLNKENPGAICIVGIGASVLYNVIYWALLGLMGMRFAFTALLRLLPLYVLYDMAVILILYPLFLRSVVKHRQDRRFNG